MRVKVNGSVSSKRVKDIMNARMNLYTYTRVNIDVRSEP